MGTAQPLSRPAKVAFVTLFVVPVVALVTWTYGPKYEQRVLPPGAVDLFVADDGLTVESRFAVGSCRDALRLDVSETASRIEVRTVVRDEVDGSCGGQALPGLLTYRLQQPIGERPLVAVG